MPILRPRTRVVYFRLSQQEFDQYSQLCETQGSRSLSDLARSALARLLESGDSLENRFNVLEQKLMSMDAKVTDLVARIAAWPPQKPE